TGRKNPCSEIPADEAGRALGSHCLSLRTSKAPVFAWTSSKIIRTLSIDSGHDVENCGAIFNRTEVDSPIRIECNAGKSAATVFPSKRIREPGLRVDLLQNTSAKDCST